MPDCTIRPPGRANPAERERDMNDIFVSPDGSDTWTGRRDKPRASRSDGPVASPAEAVRRARGLAGPPRRIVLRGGDYALTEPIDVGPDDEGLTIEAAPGEHVTLYGGRRITEWRPDGEKFWAAELPEVAAGKWDFSLLTVNGRLARRARLPEKGFFEHCSEFKVRWMSTTGGGWQRKPTQAELTAMVYRKEDLGPWLDVRNAELTIYHMWDESMVGLSAMDPNTRTLTFSTPAGHPPGAFNVHKYEVWNVREGMTEPGRWYLDRSAGKVVYWPRESEDMTRASVYAPAIESILRIRGEKDRPACGITIRGLTLTVTNTPLVAGGFGAGRFPGAVDLQHAADCVLEGLTVTHVAGQAIKGEHCRAIRIENCHLHQIGACGITFSGTESTVRNCHVHDTGLIYPSAIAVRFTGQNHAVVHNEVHDTSYSAVNSSGADSRFEHNHIYRAMKNLHDGAAIYITFCKRIALRGNFVHDIVDTGGYGASAYYLDEQAEHCLVENNVSYNVVRPSHNHMARNNTIRNNVFVSDGELVITFMKSADYRFERNVCVAGGALRIAGPEAIASMGNNVLFSGEGEYFAGVHTGAEFREPAPLTVRDGTVQADPKLTGAAEGDVRFAAGSPATKLGIEPVDVHDAGPLER